MFNFLLGLFFGLLIGFTSAVFILVEDKLNGR